MCSSLPGINIIYIRVDVFGIAFIILDGQLYRHHIYFPFNQDRFTHHRFAILIKIGYKVFDSAIIMEYLLLFFFTPLITQLNRNIWIQEGQLTHPFSNNLVFKLGCLLKDGIIRGKSNNRSGFIRLAFYFQRLYRFAVLKFHHKYFPLASYLRIKMRRESIYTAHTYTMQSTGYFIITFIILSSGVQLC